MKYFKLWNNFKSWKIYVKNVWELCVIAKREREQFIYGLKQISQLQYICKIRSGVYENVFHDVFSLWHVTVGGVPCGISQWVVLPVAYLSGECSQWHILVLHTPCGMLQWGMLPVACHSEGCSLWHVTVGGAPRVYLSGEYSLLHITTRIREAGDR